MITVTVTFTDDEYAQVRSCASRQPGAPTDEVFMHQMAVWISTAWNAEHPVVTAGVRDTFDRPNQ